MAHHQTATGGAMPLGSSSAISIASSIHSGATELPSVSSAMTAGGRSSSVLGTQLSGLEYPASLAVPIIGVCDRVPLACSECACLAVCFSSFGVQSPLAMAMAAAFSLHLTSWAGCPPPQLGHFNTVWEHTFPLVPQVTTSHLWSTVRCCCEQIEQTSVPPWWQRNSLCPQWLHLPQSTSALSAMNGRAQNLTPTTHMSRRRSRRSIWVWLFDFVVDADTSLRMSRSWKECRHLAPDVSILERVSVTGPVA